MAKKKTDELEDKLSELSAKYAGIFEKALVKIGKDFDTVVKLGEKKIKNLVDLAFSEDYQKDLGNTIFKYAKQGKERTTEVLKEKKEQYDTKLNELVKTKPEAAGMIDGVLNAYLATPCDRRPKSKIYKLHVKYGQSLGFVSSAVIFVPSRGYRMAIGAMPVLSRAVKYLHKKVSQAETDYKK